MRDCRVTQFKDRQEAGRLLGRTLARYAEFNAGIERPGATPGMANLRVVALPRGGVPVGFEVALALNAPLDVFIVRKLGMPGNPELAMGAIASGEARILNRDLIETLEIPPELIENVIERETEVIRSRELAYGIHDRPVDYSGKLVILVDDGAATGATMRVAVQALRQRHARRIVVGLPTASSQAADLLRRDADEVITLIESDCFQAVGQWYRHFDQTTDEEVIQCLKKANEAIHPAANS